jgi:hypothetical protein
VCFLVAFYDVLSQTPHETTRERSKLNNDYFNTQILLSNDKNLCNKAAINGVRCIELGKLRPLLHHAPHKDSNPGLHDRVTYYEDAMYQLLANILEVGVHIITSDSPRLRTGVVLILNCFSVILCMLYKA